MVYRELFNLRIKATFWVIVYLGSMILYLVSHTFYGPMPVSLYLDNGVEMYNTLFGGWLKVLVLITPALALLGAPEAISEEVGKGTLSFLLTRPFTRTRIYTTKILLSAAIFLIGGTISSLIVLLVDQLPRQVLILRWTTSPCGDNSYCSGWISSSNLEPSRPAEILPSLIATAVVLIGGTLIVFATGLLSIYTRNVIQTILAALPVVLLVGLVLNGNGPFARVNQFAPMEAELLRWSDTIPRLFWLMGLGIVSMIIFGGGLLAFNRREF